METTLNWLVGLVCCSPEEGQLLLVGSYCDGLRERRLRERCSLLPETVITPEVQRLNGILEG